MTCADTGEQIQIGDQCPGCFLEGQPGPCVTEGGGE